MKAITLHILFIIGFSLNLLSQEASHSEIDLKKEEFIRSIAKIELVQLEPICRIKTVDMGFLRRRKKVMSCHASSALFCVEIGDRLSCKFETERIKGNTQVMEKDVQKILNIIYKSEEVNYLAACYNPRHGMLLFDHQGEPVGFIEICFECAQARSTTGVPEFGLLPQTAFDILRTIFDRYNLN